MTGFGNVIHGVENFFHHNAEPSLKAAALKLMPSIKAVAAEAETEVEKAIAVIKPIAAQAIAGTITKSAAGSQAKAAVVAAGVAIGKDALSALVTALLTA